MKLTDKQQRSPIKWIKDAWHLARPYWKSEERYKAIGLLSIVIICNLLFVYMTVVSNSWSNKFYDSIQRYDKVAFYRLLVKFAYIAFFYIGFQILSSYFRKFLEIRWRRWLTKHYLTEWFSKKAHYKMRFLDRSNDNPDQRISEDINSFISLFLDLTLGLISSTVSLASFVVILWHVGGVLNFAIQGHHITLPGYMVWAALVYAIIGTYILFKIGKPLINLNFMQEAYEANFRYGLVRIREYSENIAFYNGESQEKSGLVERFTNVVDNFVAIIYRSMKIGIFSIGYDQLSVVFPTLMCAPRYFAKTIQLGDLMQISSAFARVLSAMSFFMNAYTSLASWRAVMDRLYGFQSAVEDASNLGGIFIKPGNNYLESKNLGINLPSGKALAKEINFSLNKGDRLLVNGRSGSGKTTLLRVIAGIWPYTSGEIYQKPELSSLFISQKPYLPLGTLKAAICYPKTNDLPDDVSLIKTLDLCNLSHLVTELHSASNWSEKLSLGEQQRIAFCRVLINAPDIVYLDEATSALDEETEAQMYQLICTTLAESVILSVGHRSTIKQWHAQELDFNQFKVAQ